MIKRSFIFAAVLICVYAVLFQSFIHGRGVNTIQSQFQGNLVKAQDYLYNTTRHGRVIVGTSMAAGLVMDSLPGEYYNLAMAGMSIFDGLKLVEVKESKPEYLFIEMNFFTIPADKDFQNTILSPVNYQLKKNIPFLGDNVKPVALTGEFILNILRWIKHGGKSIPSSKEIATETRVDSNLKQELIDYQLMKSENLPDSTLVNSSLNQLSSQISELQAQGIKVCFFEMPVDTALQSAISAIYLRQAFNKKFNSTVYNQINLPPSEAFPTIDGIHLTHIGALRYTVYFRDQQEKLQ